ncbi:protein kinase [Lujinxingia vulgaris]|uniref:Protein kinase n=1 Tax=Lujinxingia vulgaris TaxID=2600176 RepID=A0A5C6X7I6_9DELT|nr:serine/threonine-protein kinase [Lujinxingia vulgaris]TXD33995.1 protein kinase [Lujinxingia vulgaris]
MTTSEEPSSGSQPITPSGVRLGKFQIFEQIGQGAMGEVYRGHHPEQGMEVAVKVISGEQAGEQRYQRAFGHEVRSVAGLDHPGIVRLFDYGVIGESDEALAPRAFRPGSPYLVMEYARAGTLAGLMDEALPWAVIELVVYAILDALAHSHARGVVHRDIKPQNVLLDRGEEGWPGVLLTDFGLAYALQPDEGAVQSKKVAGTPQYMAPEQLLGRWRDYGPATDLYALGCVIFEMVCGQVPFGGDNVMQIARAHLDKPVPALRPRSEVPEGVEGWLSRLLAKDPKQRWASAAVAARELRRAVARAPSAVSARQWRTLLQANVGSTHDMPRAEVRGPGSGQMSPFHALMPLLNFEPVRTEGDVAERYSPLPANWERPRRASSVRVAGAGLGLFGLRRLPTVGRLEEREQLWSTLREVIGEREPAAVMLTGAPGVGKDHLAEWLVERAQEVGSARALRVRYRADGEASDAMGEALMHHLSLEGLKRNEVMARLEGIVRAGGGEDPYLWRAMTELLLPSQPGDEGGVRMSGQAQRQRTLADFLMRLAMAGPLIIRLQDVHHGVEALGWVSLLLHQLQEPVPILVVMSARDDAMALSETHAHAMGELREGGAFLELPVEALSPAETQHFVEELLFLEPGLAREVAERCAGNPLVATTLVARWIERELLHPTLDGFRLERDTGVSELQDDELLWLAPALALADVYGEDRLFALQLAAVLGARFELKDWRTACELAGIPWSMDVVEHLLVRRHLVEVGGDKLAFAQNLLKEALLTHLRGSGGWQKAHALCAQVLEPAVERGEEGALERSAAMLKEGGEPEEAVRRYMEASELRRVRGEQHVNAYLLDQAWQALERMDARDSEAIARLRVELAVARAWAYNSLYYIALALEWAERAEALALALGDAALVAQARAMAGACSVMGGQPEQGERLLRQALAHFREYGSREFPRAYVTCATALARSLARRSEWAEVSILLEEAAVQADASGDMVMVANARYETLILCVRRGDVPSLAEVDELIAICELADQSMGLSETYNLRAEVLRLQGDLEGARAALERSVHYCSRVNVQNGTVAMMNLGLMLIVEDNIEGSRSYFERAAVSLRRQRRPQLLLYAVLGCLVNALNERDRGRVQQLAEEALRLIRDTQFYGDGDARLLIETATALAEDGGEQWGRWARLKELREAMPHLLTAP